MYDMLIQGIGLIAFALFLLSYQVRSNRGLFAMQTAGNFLFALQFFLLGGVGGAVGSLISCFRNSLLLGSKKYPILGAKFWPVLICALSLTSCICSWQNWFSILPFFAVLSATIGYWRQRAQDPHVQSVLRLSMLADLQCLHPLSRRHFERSLRDFIDFAFDLPFRIPRDGREPV